MMPEGPCFNQIPSSILLKNVTPRRCDNRVKKACREYYPCAPGFIFRDVPVLISRVMLVGIDEDVGRLLVPFRKPCYGTSLYIIDSDPDEIAALRAALRDAVPATPQKERGVRKKPKNPENSR